MLKVQVITNADYKNHNYVVNRIDNNQAFDAFDYNIIDLSDSSIWVNKSNSFSETIKEKDLVSINKQINNSKTSKFVIIYPKNIVYHYNYCYGEYNGKCKLRDNLYGLKTIISFVYNVDWELEYEQNEALINNKKVKSDFYFLYEYPNFINKIYANNSNKLVSFTCESITYTTLDILGEDVVDVFLKHISTQEMVDYPEWFKTISFNDDEQLRKDYKKNIEAMEKAKQENGLIKEKMSKNNYYKSILLETGDKLVEIVFSILEQILKLDLSSFVDEKKEDFNFLLGETSCVGEIKGVNEGIRNSHLSQLENNKQLYMEDNEINNSKGILIINDQRKKPLNERKSVHDNQIKYAKDHDLLIIQTKTLLQIYESYLKQELDLEKLKELMLTMSGLLVDEWR